MTTTDNKQLDKMKQFLFHEVSNAEREEMEERFFTDNDYFYDMVNLENDLVDKYTRGELRGSELTRFEKGFVNSPERRTKISNSRALQKLIVEEREAVTKIVEKVSVWRQISGFFSFQIPAFQYSIAGLLIAMAAGAGFLLYQNVQVGQDLARLKDKDQEFKQLEQKFYEKEKEIAAIRNRETEAIKRVTDLQEKSNTQSDELEKAIREKQEISDEARQRMIEIATLKQKLEQRRDLPTETPRQTPTSAPPSSVLAFSIIPIGSKGNPAGISVKSVIARGRQNARVTVDLPTDKNYSIYEIAAGGKTIKSGSLENGASSLTFELPPKDTEFEVFVREADTRGGNQSLGKYKLQTKQQRR